MATNSHIAGGTSERIDPYLQPQPGIYGQAFPHLPPLNMNTAYFNLSNGPRQALVQGNWDRLNPMHPTTFVQAVVDSQPENAELLYGHSAQYPKRVQRAAALKAEEAWRQNRQMTGETDKTTQISETPDGGSSQLTDDYIMVSPQPQSPIDAYICAPSYIPNLTLKGVVYPGMGLFDAATVDEKAKRNQKKSDATYKALETLSQDIADNFGWENIWQTDEDGNILCPYKARIITGYPAASSLASSSRSPSPVKRPSHTLHNRSGLGQAKPADDDIENDLINNIAPRRRMHIPRREDHDEDSHDPFIDRPWLAHSNRLASHATINPHQENELANSLSANGNAKIEDDGTDSGMGQPVPTIEPPIHQSFPPNGATFAVSTAPNQMFPPATPYNRTLPNPFFGQSPSHMSAYNATQGFFQASLSRYPGNQNNFASPNRYHGNAPPTNGFLPSLSSPIHTMNVNYNPLYPQLSPSHHNHYPRRTPSMNEGINANFNMNNGFNSGMNGSGFSHGGSNSLAHGTNAGFNHVTHYGYGYGFNSTGRLDDLAQVAARQPGSDFMGTDGANDGADDDRTLTAIPSSALDVADAAAIASAAAAEAAEAAGAMDTA
jgi:hypothetical protein